MDIKGFRMIAQGGQAQIYEYGDGKVLRVLRNPKDAELLQYEIEITKALQGSGVSVPEMYESLTVEDKPAVIVQRINGISMLDDMKRHPLQLRKEAKTLASLHLKVSQNMVPGLKPARGRARYLTEQAQELSAEAKAFVQKQIDLLPDDSALCHGDFHPGNILKADGRNYIIDWFGAYQGDILSDVAHTVLILKKVPRFPGVGAAAYTVMRITGGMIANVYLNAFRSLTDFDPDRFGRWLVVKAAERCCYGMPAEKPALMHFIEKCMQSEASPSAWCSWI